MASLLIPSKSSVAQIASVVNAASRLVLSVSEFFSHSNLKNRVAINVLSLGFNVLGSVIESICWHDISRFIVARIRSGLLQDTKNADVRDRITNIIIINIALYI